MKTKQSVSKKSKETEINQFPIIGMGASAGGLEALELFFTNLLPDTGMAFVVIQHLDPTHIGMMPELLQRITQLKVLEAEDRHLVKPNHIYVIPPNKSLSILNGKLHLFVPKETRGMRLPIDFFFKSLAEDRQEKSIGVILSGMGSDGSIGLQAIKEKNGLAMIQDPDTAKFDGMPKSAMNAVNADFVASPEEMPGKLISILKYVSVTNKETTISPSHKSNLEKIIILLRDYVGHDFSLYKKSTLFRRIERRKEVHQIDKIQNYVRFVQENPKELGILYKELLIGVTSFFRDEEVWEKLKEDILPSVFSRLPDGYVLRVWIPGCSSGEEAYSMAIIFKEVIEILTTPRNLTVQIFATDIDHESIEKARKGFFSANISATLSTERLKRFFIQEGDVYRINGSIREMIVFASQNVIKDPPFTKLDLISCRNMLIYMEPELQKKLMYLFNYSLNPGGIMLLGTAESVGNIKDGFKELNSKCKIYERSESVISSDSVGLPSSFYYQKPMQKSKEITLKTTGNIQTIAEDILLQHFSPASVLVNSKGDIIYITGHTGKYLEPVAGKANWNIFAMAREGLRHELPRAFRKTMKNADPVKLKNIRIAHNGDFLHIDVTLQYLDTPESVKGMILVVFKDIENVSEKETVSAKKGTIRSSSQQKELENELQRAYDEIQSTREEMQTSQEELKSMNEELQSTNEELQSSNEELTTSKEEMQSLNEELQTVNIELQSKVNDYVQADNDMKNLLNSTEIATLFLDKELNVRRYTNPVTEIIKLRSSDIGRPYSDLVSNLQYPELDNHAHQVLKTLITLETAIATISNKWFNVRIMPYRTLDDHIDGLVITFTDITKHKELEIELNKANDLLNRQKKK